MACTAVISPPAPPGNGRVKAGIFLCRPAAIFALLFGKGDALALALEDVLALELVDHRECSQHELTGRRCGADRNLY